jgi:hypothetical protein
VSLSESILGHIRNEDRHETRQFASDIHGRDVDAIPQLRQAEVGFSNARALTGNGRLRSGLEADITSTSVITRTLINAYLRNLAFSFTLGCIQ